MINSQMMKNLDTNNNFNKLKMALLKIGVSVEIVERCATMEHLIGVLQSSDDIKVYDNNTITVGDYLIVVDKDGGLDIAGLESITRMRVQTDGYASISDDDSVKLVNKYGVVERAKHLGTNGRDMNMFTAERIMLGDIPYIQAGVTELNFHIDDGNPLFISSAIRTAYNYDDLRKRYGRLDGWYASRWGSKFNKKALERAVDEEVEEDLQYRKDMGMDEDGM